MNPQSNHSASGAILFEMDMAFTLELDNFSGLEHATAMVYLDTFGRCASSSTQCRLLWFLHSHIRRR
jgi:hypothetical protein